MDLLDATSRIVVPLLGVLGVIAAAWIANRHAELKRLEVIEAQCRVLKALPAGDRELSETMSRALSNRVSGYGAWISSRRVRRAVDAASALIWVHFLVSFANGAFQDNAGMQFSSTDYATIGLAALAFATILALTLRILLNAMFVNGGKLAGWLEAVTDRLIDDLILRRRKAHG